MLIAPNMRHVPLAPIDASYQPIRFAKARGQ
jgi:hypothetical protein